MNTSIDKQELINWINDLEDQVILQILQSVKNSHTKGDWWDAIPEVAKEGIERGEADIQAGQVYSSKEFWNEISRRRKNRT